jgi:hypothetical protein
MAKSSGDGITLAVIAMYIFIFFINLAWIGALIWALIYVVLHLDNWLG